MIIVTGSAGFIGSNILKGLNEQGHTDIIAVDNLTNGKKYINQMDADISDYIDKDDLLTLIENKALPKITAIIHQGACSSTTEWDGKYMMKNNYDYSKTLLHYCIDNKTPYIYASSAAVYGIQKTFKEEKKYENPLNIYGYSKYLFDNYVRKNEKKLTSQVVGLRYFNVYGPRENHKGTMASVMNHFNQQIHTEQKVKLFTGCDGYKNGEQERDFIYIDDITNVNLWFLNNPTKSGIYNLGSGTARTFNDAAKAVIAWHEKNTNTKGKITYIPFPEKLKGCYQSYTKADLTNLRATGCDVQFHTLEQGTEKYLDWLNKNNK